MSQVIVAASAAAEAEAVASAHLDEQTLGTNVEMCFSKQLLASRREIAERLGIVADASDLDHERKAYLSAIERMVRANVTPVLVRMRASTRAMVHVPVPASTAHTRTNPRRRRSRHGTSSVTPPSRTARSPASFEASSS